MSILKWLLIGVAVLIGVLILFFGIYFWFAMKNANAVAKNVDILCEVPVGTSLDVVMQKALELGFQIGAEDFAVPAQISYIEGEPGTAVDPLKLPLSDPMTTEKIATFKNGTIYFERSAILFERHGCQMMFKDGKLISTHRSFLD